MPEKPRCGTVYTLVQVLGDKLDLWDSPHLNFINEKGKRDSVQDAHLNNEQLLAKPGWAETEWVYRFRTDEWCEIFQAKDSVKIRLLVEEYDNGYGDTLSRPK